MPPTKAKGRSQGKWDRMASLKSRVTAIVKTFTTMRSDLDAERKAMTKIWAMREKQIERIVINAAGLHGDLQGIIGKSLPAIEALELGSIAQSPEAPEDGET